MWINIVCLIVIFGAGYFFWVRPILKQRPQLKFFWDAEDSFFATLSLKLAGIKQKLAGALMILAMAYVEISQYIMPALGLVDTTPITSKLPAWLVPLIGIAAVALLNYFRSLADRRTEGEA